MSFLISKSAPCRLYKGMGLLLYHKVHVALFRPGRFRAFVFELDLRLVGGALVYATSTSQRSFFMLAHNLHYTASIGPGPLVTMPGAIWTFWTVIPVPPHVEHFRGSPTKASRL